MECMHGRVFLWSLQSSASTHAAPSPVSKLVPADITRRSTREASPVACDLVLARPSAVRTLTFPHHRHMRVPDAMKTTDASSHVPQDLWRTQPSIGALPPTCVPTSAAPSIARRRLRRCPHALTSLHMMSAVQRARSNLSASEHMLPKLRIVMPSPPHTTKRFLNVLASDSPLRCASVI